jgi:hypothetical protein
MSYYQIPLKAGVPFKQNTPGRLFLIDSIGAAPGVGVTFINKGGAESTTIPNRQAGFRHVSEYEGVILTSPVDATVSVFLSVSDVQLGFVAGSTVSVPGGVTVNNTPANRIPVDLGGAAVAVTVTAVGINNDAAHPVPVSLVSAPDTDAIPVKNQALSTLVNGAPVVAGVAAVTLSNDATLRRLIVRNSHATAIIAIGGPAVTMANAAIQLLPGDVWREDDAAGANWSVISDTANVNVQVMGVR